MATSAVHCVRKIAALPDAVWAVLGSFDVSWHPYIAHCTVLRDADGALLRSFADQDGTVYEERRSYISDTDRVLCYTLVKGIEGILTYNARIEVTEDSGASVVTWSATIAAPADRADKIAEGTRAIFEAGLDALPRLPKAKPPSQRKPPQTGAEPKSLRLEGVPSLGLRTGANIDEGSDTLVLFLHGIGGNARNWDAQIAALGTTYRVAALDLRGYGQSTLGHGPSQVDDYCADIEHVRKALGAERLVLAGLSYGSWIATSFAMRHGGRLAGLILAGGCTGMSEADPRERENFRVSREIPMDAGQTPADFAPAVVQIIAGPSASEAQRKEMTASMAAIPSATYRDALQCFTNPLERFDFSKLDCPVLLFTGAHDKLAPPQEIRRVSERILEERALHGGAADVRFEVIPDAGHICNLEAPDVTNALLHRFLARLPGGARDYKASLMERQRDKAARIRQAAHDEFCENGFDGASMDRIALRADVSKPTIYQYFGGKDELLDAVLDAGRTQIVAPLAIKEGTLAQRLWRFAWVYAEFVLRPDMLSLARLILGEAARRPDAAMAYHSAGPARAFEGLVDFVREAVAAGELETDAPDLAAQNLWSLILSGPRDHYLHHADARPGENELLRSISHGLRVFLKAYGTDPEAQIAQLETHISARAETRRPPKQLEPVW